MNFSFKCQQSGHIVSRKPAVALRAMAGQERRKIRKSLLGT
jgi:hypothetical protein